jgi:hypothetical protein
MIFCRARIELKRVQTFLFEVPRMRAMLGANARLGETLRLKLATRYLDARSRYLPQDLDVSALQRILDRKVSDPLEKAIENWRRDPAFDGITSIRRFRDLLSDAPLESYRKGILARDGGRFNALFSGRNEQDALEKVWSFVQEAESLVAEELPGVRIGVRVDKFAKRDGESNSEWSAVEPKPRDPLGERLPLDLPVFRRCEEIPNEPATTTVPMPDRNTSKLRDHHVSASFRVRYQAGRAFTTPGRNVDSTLDLVSLMRRRLPLDEFDAPQDFEALAAGGYLAVIHADGNGMGDRARGLQKDKTWPDFSSWLASEAEVESLYYQMRVIVRNAVVKSLEATFGSYEPPRRSARTRPYQLMMLGGDDLLLVCRAEFALKYVVEYARAIREQCKLGSDSFPHFKEVPLTIGAGVVIAQHTLPFYRLNELAEGLSASAKRLYRAFEKEGRHYSVVDWMVCTNSWAADPAEDRERFELIAEADVRLALSGKPYRVLTAESEGESRRSNDLASLEGLLVAAEKLSNGMDRAKRAARSQLKALPEALARGESLGELAWRELPPELSDMLSGSGFDKKTPWERSGDKRRLTRVGDLVEVYEISRLGRRPEARGTLAGTGTGT